MAIDHRMVHFRTNDFSEVARELDLIAERANGREWVTISPWVDPEDLPVVSLLSRLLSGRGSKVPVVTWTPAIDREPAQLGILHATGPNAFDRIAEAGASMPSEWIKVSDHSKRGLVLAVHPDASASSVVRFAVAAAGVLAQVPTDDRWVAEVSTSKR